MDPSNFTTSKDLNALRHLLTVLIASYCLGWGILIVNVGRVPMLHPYIWAAAAAVCFAFTIWLAITLSIRALTWWASVVLSTATVRTFAYAVHGIYNPCGVWLLVLTGVSITGLTVISVNALTGRVEKKKR